MAKRSTQRGGPASLAVCLVLVACGHLTEMTKPPSDWPKLEIVDNGAKDLLASCSKYTSILTWPPLGCAEVHFQTMKCHIWHLTGWIRAEEIKHCQGRDHEGESTLADAWQVWKSKATR